MDPLPLGVNPGSGANGTSPGPYGRRQSYRSNSHPLSMIGSSEGHGPANATVLGQLNHSMGNITMSSSMDVNSRSFTPSSSNSNKNKSEEESSRNNLPVKYHIAWNKSSTAFTITLLIPKHGQTENQDASTKTKSPFQLVEHGNGSNSNSNNGKEKHMLTIPLSYLVNLASNQAQASSSKQKSAPWLDRSTLRARLSDGGKAIGLESSHIFHTIAAVEESATRIAEWSPPNTEAVRIDVMVSDGVVSLVANVNVRPKNMNNFMYQSNSHPQALPSGASANNSASYNVLNESSGSLLATAPSFISGAGDLSLSHSFSNQNDQQQQSLNGDIFKSSNSSIGSHNNTDNNNIRRSSFSSLSASDGIFGSNNQNHHHNHTGTPKGSLSSSFDPWNSKPTGGSRRDFAQEQQHHQGQSGVSNQFMQNESPFNIPAVLNLSSSDQPVNPNELFPTQSGMNVGISNSQKNGSNMLRMSDSQVKRNVSVNASPDPMIIIEPLLAMGFSRAECEAAVIAIRNLAITGNMPPHEQDRNMQRMRSSSFQVQQPQSNVQKQQHYHHQQQQQYQQQQHQRQVSGEDILGYVLNNGSGVSTFERNMAEAVAADNFNSLNTSHHRDSHSIAQVATTVTNSRNGPTHSEDHFISSEENHAVGSSGGGVESWSSVQSEQNEVSQQNGPVWGNAGKLKVVKSSSSNGSSALSPEQFVANTVKAEESVVENSAEVDANWNGSAQTQKAVKVLDIPPELNAFVFHCNSQTREECLQRGLFGCPSGGQYGPHSKAKKGDLLFLADFSAWTVTGIFTAKTDAGLNIDKSAWGGRFPWQIQVNAWTDLRTVHIDKVNEIIGLASGSKLNMLSKDQLLQLVTSKEFGPCVPPHLFKVKPIPQILSAGSETVERAKYSELEVSGDPNLQSGSRAGTLASGANGIKYSRTASNLNTADEHPATAMHRLKLVASWFDSCSSQILLMNETFNNRKSSSKKENLKDKAVLDEGIISVMKNCTGQSWPLMSYSHIRRAIGDVFDQWLLLAHATAGERAKGGGGSNDKSDNSTWTRQQGRSNSSNGKMREDIVLLQRVPGAVSCIQSLFQATSGTSAMAVPSGIAEVLATKFVREIEQISVEVRKTQLSLLKIGGDNFMKSIEDKSLGMKISEASSKSPESNTERTLVRIEWHTKSSIAQGRPPQVQKLYKTHFDVLEKNYRNQAASEDPGMSHFLTRLFVLLCRYDLIGDVKHRCQAVIPSMAQKAIAAQFGVGHECFASPLSNSRASFNTSLFADTNKFFGSLGSFFDFIPIEGSFIANPPFIGNTLKPMFDHIFRVLQHSDNDRSALSFLIIIRGTNPILNNVKRSHFCRRILTLEDSPKYAVNTLYKDTVSASRKQPKSSGDDINMLDCVGAWSESNATVLVWLQNDCGHNVWNPSDDKVGQVVDGFRTHPSTVAIAV